MTVRLFLFISVLFHFSLLATEKLVIAPTSPNDNIPKEVRKAVEAIGMVSGKTGFFIDEGVFISPLETKWGEKIVNGGRLIIQFREATENEVAVKGHLQLGEIIIVTGLATFIGGHMVNGRGNWGVFKVDNEDGEELFTVEPTRFLKFSEFQTGDRVFLLSNYYYSDENLNDKKTRKKNLIMKVSDSPIEDIDVGIDLEKSVVLRNLKSELSNVIAVNQRGEVVGFIDFKEGKGKLEGVSSDLIASVSEVTQEIAPQRRVNGRSWSPSAPIREFSRADTNPDRSEGCFNQFRQSVKK